MTTASLKEVSLKEGGAAVWRAVVREQRLIAKGDPSKSRDTEGAAFCRCVVALKQRAHYRDSRRTGRIQSAAIIRIVTNEGRRFDRHLRVSQRTDRPLASVVCKVGAAHEEPPATNLDGGCSVVDKRAAFERHVAAFNHDDRLRRTAAEDEAAQQ